MGVTTTRVVQGNGQTWHSMAYEQRKGFFQRIKATHTDDSIDHSILYQFNDLRKTFSHDTQTSKLFCLVL